MEHRKGVIKEIGERRGAFAFAFVSIFLVAFLFLASVGATPEPLHPSVVGGATAQTPASGNAMQAPEAPVRVVAKDIALDATVSNPASTELKVLDRALLGGAVRYPTSALLGVDGTVLLFGHSSYLPIVHNQAFKTFDGIQDLKTGQIVSVYSNNVEYRYSVVQVKVADATQDVIELKNTGRHLILVTCDSFASKSNRFIVTADFVGTYALH